MIVYKIKGFTPGSENLIALGRHVGAQLVAALKASGLPSMSKRLRPAPGIEIFVNAYKFFDEWMVDLYLSAGGQRCVYGARIIGEDFRQNNSREYYVGVYTTTRPDGTKKLIFSPGTPVGWYPLATYRELPPTVAYDIDRLIGITNGISRFEGELYGSVSFSRTRSNDPPVYVQDGAGVQYNEYYDFYLPHAFAELAYYTLNAPSLPTTGSNNNKVPYKVSFTYTLAGEIRSFEFTIPDIREVMTKGSAHVEALGDDSFSKEFYTFVVSNIYARVFYVQKKLYLYAYAQVSMPYVGRSKIGQPDPPPPSDPPPTYPPLPTGYWVSAYSVGPTLIGTEIGLDGRTYYTYEQFNYAGYWTYSASYIYNYVNSSGQRVKIGKSETVGSRAGASFAGLTGGPTSTCYVYFAPAVYMTTTTDLELYPPEPPVPPAPEQWWIDEDNKLTQRTLPFIMERTAGSISLFVYATTADEWNVEISVNGSAEMFVGKVPKPPVSSTEVTGSTTREYRQAYDKVFAAPLHEVGVFRPSGGTPVDLGRVGTIRAVGLGKYDGLMASCMPVWWEYGLFINLRLAIASYDGMKAVKTGEIDESGNPVYTVSLREMLVEYIDGLGEYINGENDGLPWFAGASAMRSALVDYLATKPAAQDKEPVPTEVYAIMKAQGEPYCLRAAETGAFDPDMALMIGPTNVFVGNPRTNPDPLASFALSSSVPPLA